MPPVRHHDPNFEWMFQPFVKSRQGQILIPSPPRDHIRDGMAAMLLARHFSLPRYEQIVVEPSRPSLIPARNMLVIGQVKMFLDGAQPGMRQPSPTPVDRRLIGERFGRLIEEACYRHEASPAVVNSITRASWASGNTPDGKEYDYGIIQRACRGAAENTLVCSGNHWLGTLGAAMVSTDSVYLGIIRRAVSRIEGLDPSLPVEVLVRATFDPLLADGNNDPRAITAVPLEIVYNRRGAARLDVDPERWVDQRPWDLECDAWEDPTLERIPAAQRMEGRSLLEVEMDLSGCDPELRERCRKHLTGKIGQGECATSWPVDKEELVNYLITCIDRTHMTFHELAPLGPRPPLDIPGSAGSSTRRDCQRFLLTLVLSLFAGIRFHPDESNIRSLFPEFSRRKSAAAKTGRQGLSTLFKGAVNGRMREIFGRLFGASSRSRGHLEVRLEGVGNEKHYRLRLKQSGVRLKMRF